MNRISFNPRTYCKRKPTESNRPEAQGDEGESFVPSETTTRRSFLARLSRVFIGVGVAGTRSLHSPAPVKRRDEDQRYALTVAMEWLRRNDFPAAADTTLADLQSVAFDGLDSLGLHAAIGMYLNCNEDGGWIFRTHARTLQDYIRMLGDGGTISFAVLPLL